MRIVYLLTTADASAGTENAVLTQANALAPFADVEVLSVHRTARRPHFAVSPRVRLRYIADRPETATPSRVIPKSWDDQFDAATDDAVAAALQRIRADIAVTTTPALAYLAARYVRSDIKLVHQEHRVSWARGAGWEPLRLAAPRLDAIVALTEVNAAWLNEKLAGIATHVAVIPNGMDVTGSPVSSLDQRLIVSAGRMVPAKQFEHVIEAFHRASENVPDWQLRIYGDGPSRVRLQTVIRRLGLEARVSLPGVVPDLPTQLAKASVFALASRSEALPLVLLEAQAAGVPLVSYDTQTGPREIIEATGGGILVPRGSRNGLAAAMQTLMADDELRRRYGATARQGVRQFDLEEVTKRWRSFYASLSSRSLEPTTLSATDDTEQDGETMPVALPHRIEDNLLPELTRRNIAWRRVPTRGAAWKVVTSHSSVDDLLAAVRAQGEDRAWIVARIGGQAVTDPWPEAGEAPLLARHADELVLQREDGAPLGVVQMWHRNDEGLYERPAPDRGPAWVDEESWEAWTRSGAATVSGAPYWDEVTFPIDLVYTWVDGDDPAWRARRAPFIEDRSDQSSDAVRDARFRNRNELYYSISSVKRYMPWVNRIYVVTDRQVPARVMADFTDVIIVDHSEIFPDPSVLPVFNSHAIEATLHRIPGLSEHYIYFNDDILVARPLTPDQFFLSNGVAKFFPHGVEINYGGHDDKPHLQAGANNRALLLRDFGVEIVRGMMHTPHPQRRSVAEDLERSYPEEFARTRASRFRSPTDISVASSLVPYYGYLTGRHIPGSIGYRYASLRADALSSRLQHILNDPRVAVVALAEPMNEDRRHRDEDAILLSFLEELVHRGNPAPAVSLATTTLEEIPATAAVASPAVPEVDILEAREASANDAV